MEQFEENSYLILLKPVKLVKVTGGRFCIPLVVTLRRPPATLAKLQSWPKLLGHLAIFGNIFSKFISDPSSPSSNMLILDWAITQ